MLAVAISNRVGKTIISRLGCVPSILLIVSRLAGKWMGSYSDCMVGVGGIKGVGSLKMVNTGSKMERRWFVAKWCIE